jgi:hypothetical protein
VGGFDKSQTAVELELRYKCVDISLSLHMQHHKPKLLRILWPRDIVHPEHRVRHWPVIVNCYQGIIPSLGLAPQETGDCQALPRQCLLFPLAGPAGLSPLCSSFPLFPRSRVPDIYS